MNRRLEELAREEYIATHSSPESDLLAKISREAHLTLTHPRMVSGHIQGLFLQMIVELMKPQKILEIGTFVCYATIALATALPKGATLTTIEVNDELRHRILEHLQQAGVAERVELIIGDALEELSKLPLEEYQLVYLDANKAQYPEYYQLLSSRLPKGALILADNTLWGEKVWHDQFHDPQTVGIRKFNQLVAEDRKVSKVILPMRDGLTMIMIK